MIMEHITVMILLFSKHGKQQQTHIKVLSLF